MRKRKFFKLGLLSLSTVISLGYYSACQGGNANNNPSKGDRQTSSNEETTDQHYQQDDDRTDDGDNDSHRQENTDDDGQSDAGTDSSSDNLMVECIGSENCEADEVCINGECHLNISASCHKKEDCIPGPCDNSATCIGGECVIDRKEVGTSCDDGDPCTINDKCNKSNHCIGQMFECITPPPDGCDENNLQYITYSNIGTCIANDQGQPECEYSKSVKDCSGNCEANCHNNCSGVICEQDTDCYISTCQEDSGSCKIAYGNYRPIGSPCSDGSMVCGQWGSCEECIYDNMCQEDETCINNKCVAKIPECEKDSCSPTDNSLKVCTNGKFRSTINCPQGCNTDQDACGCLGGHEYRGCVPGDYSHLTGQMLSSRIRHYCNPDTHSIIYQIDFPYNLSCSLYCGFQWAEMNGNSITGYGRWLKDYNKNKGGLYCTTDLSKPVYEWQKSDTEQLNSTYIDDKVNEYFSTINFIDPDKTYFCTYVTILNGASEDTQSSVYYICPPVNHNDTHNLEECILLEPNTRIPQELTRRIRG